MNKRENKLSVALGFFAGLFGVFLNTVWAAVYNNIDISTIDTKLKIYYYLSSALCIGIIIWAYGSLLIEVFFPKHHLDANILGRYIWTRTLLIICCGGYLFGIPIFFGISYMHSAHAFILTVFWNLMSIKLVAEHYQLPQPNEQVP